MHILTPKLSCVTDEPLEEDEGDPMDDAEISPADRSCKIHVIIIITYKLLSFFVFPLLVRIRSRLKKLIAKRPQVDQLKTKGILEGKLLLGSVMFSL